MKNLSIEEKAKRYDDAIEKAEKWCNAPNINKIPTFGNKIIEDIFPELYEPEDEKIRKWLIAQLELKSDMINNSRELELMILKSIDWLEKQEQSKKTSIWKHWKNGIAGNGEGKLTFLIKSGPTYSLSSCLSFECDYIELSELDSLMLEKQSKQSSNILWHDVSEEPEEQRELFCEWKGYADSIWHDVAFYHPSNKTFWNGEDQIENVVKWAYIDEMLEEQPQSQIKPKFKAGDTIQCISDKTDKRTIASSICTGICETCTLNPCPNWEDINCAAAGR